MKKFIFSCLMLFSVQVFASEVLLSYQFGEKAQSYSTIPADYFHLNRVDLYESNEMVVSLAEVFLGYPTQKQMPVFYQVQSVQLTDYQMNMIKELVKELSVAPIDIIQRTRICEIVVDEYAMIDHLYVRRDWSFKAQKFLSGLELVSTPTGCWMPLEVSPRFHSDAGKAKLLKLILQFAMR